MDALVENRAVLFRENVEILETSYRSQFALPKYLAAFLFALEDKPIDKPLLDYYFQEIGARTGIFSAFRATIQLTLAALLAVAPEADRQLDEVVEAHELLKKAGFFSGDYLVLAAYELVRYGQGDAYEDMAQKARAVYLAIKQRHSVITNTDDYAFSAIAALSALSPGEVAERLEEVFEGLQPGLWNRNDCQGLAEVLLQGPSPRIAATYIPALKTAFRQAGVGLDGMGQLPILGVMAGVCRSPQQCAEEVRELFDYLKAHRLFSPWRIQKGQLLPFCVGLVASTMPMPQGVDTALVPKTMASLVASIVVAQAAAMAAAAGSGGR